MILIGPVQKQQTRCGTAYRGTGILPVRTRPPDATPPTTRMIRSRRAMAQTTAARTPDAYGLRIHRALENRALDLLNDTDALHRRQVPSYHRTRRESRTLDIGSCIFPEISARNRDSESPGFPQRLLNRQKAGKQPETVPPEFPKSPPPSNIGLPNHPIPSIIP